jgi:hypothetical protein
MERHNYEQMSETEDEYDNRIRNRLGKVDKERVVRMFNESAGFRKLPPLRDAI